jgi:hypothetical protein
MTAAPLAVAAPTLAVRDAVGLVLVVRLAAVARAAVFFRPAALLTASTGLPGVSSAALHLLVPRQLRILDLHSTSSSASRARLLALWLV